MFLIKNELVFTNQVINILEDIHFIFMYLKKNPNLNKSLKRLFTDWFTHYASILQGVLEVTCAGENNNESKLKIGVCLC